MIRNLNYLYVDPCHNGMVRPQVSAGGMASRYGRYLKNILNKQSRTADKGWSSSLGVGRGTNNSSPQKLKHVKSNKQRPWNRTDPSVQPRAGFCECGDELSGSIKCGEFLE